MRTLIPVLAVTLGLTVAAPAVAQPADQGVPSSAVATQDLRAPDQTTQANPGPGSPGAVEITESAFAPTPASTDDGLSTALIVLLAVGGAVALAATAVVGTRYAQAHGHLHRHVSH